MEETEKKEQKFTYEQLSNIASNLSSQVQQLQGKLIETNMLNIFKKLDYNFKVIELAHTGLFTADFVNRCAKEIEELMSPAPQTDAQNTEE